MGSCFSSQKQGQVLGSGPPSSVQTPVSGQADSSPQGQGHQTGGGNERPNDPRAAALRAAEARQQAVSVVRCGSRWEGDAGLAWRERTEGGRLRSMDRTRDKRDIADPLGSGLYVLSVVAVVPALSLALKQHTLLQCARRALTRNANGHATLSITTCVLSGTPHICRLDVVHGDKSR